MLYVKTYLGTSTIEGIGLFASELIPSGTVIWKFFPRIDRAFTEEEYDELSRMETFRPLMKYIYKSRVSGNYVLCADDARFIHQCEDANTVEMPGDLEGLLVAKKDIRPNEEITFNHILLDLEPAAGFEEQPLAGAN